MEKGAFWFTCRVILILMSIAFTPFYMRSQSGDFPEPSLRFLVGMIAICAGTVFLLAAFQSFNKNDQREWYRPSWFKNPFAFNQPLQTFDSGAYDAMALGAGSLVAGLLSAPINWAWELPMSIGLGLWIGVRFCLVIFKNRIVEWPA